MREASVERKKDAVIGAYRQQCNNTLEASRCSQKWPLVRNLTFLYIVELLVGYHELNPHLP